MKTPLTKFVFFLLIAAISLFVIHGCKKSDSVPANNSNNNVLTKCDLKYIRYSGGSYEWKYTFDNINPRKLVEAQYLDENGDVKNSYHIFYDSHDTSHVIAVQEWLNDFEFLQYVDTFTYDAEGQINLEIIYNNFNDSLQPDHYYLFDYNNDGTLSKSESNSLTNIGQSLGSKEYTYNNAGDVTDIEYYDTSHNLVASEEYERSTILYGHFDIFENILHRSAWTHAPTQIHLFYSGFTPTTTNYILAADNANYLIRDEIVISPLGQNDTIPDLDYEYQCFQ